MSSSSSLSSSLSTSPAARLRAASAARACSCASTAAAAAARRALAVAAGPAAFLTASSSSRESCGVAGLRAGPPAAGTLAAGGCPGGMIGCAFWLALHCARTLSMVSYAFKREGREATPLGSVGHSTTHKHACMHACVFVHVSMRARLLR